MNVSPASHHLKVHRYTGFHKRQHMQTYLDLYQLAERLGLKTETIVRNAKHAPWRLPPRAQLADRRMLRWHVTVFTRGLKRACAHERLTFLRKGLPQARYNSEAYVDCPQTEASVANVQLVL
jgi:hypothetical protein